MWRDFLGKDAQTIGVNLNPHATKWRDFGFEIIIGERSDPNFWNELYREIEEVDILLDDGGHRNDQQLVTVERSIENVRDGRTIIVEDCQTGFMKFESFTRFSFVNLLTKNPAVVLKVFEFEDIED